MAPGNPDARWDYHRLVSTVPRHVLESRDCNVRCQWRPAFWKRGLPRGMTFLKALEQRLKLLDSWPAFTSGFLDLAAPHPARGGLRHQG